VAVSGRPTVLHVAQPTDGGVARYVAAVSADQVARGWRVVVACPDGGRLSDELATGGVSRLRWPAQRAPGRASVGEAQLLARLVGSTAPHVVHLHSSKAGLAGRLALRGRLPTLFQPHGWSWLAVQGPVAAATIRWERAATRWTEVIVCAGHDEAALGQAQRVRARYAVVRNGVDLDRFRPAGEEARAAGRASLGIDPQVPLAVCIGRVTRQKGQDLLLAAWPWVRAYRPDAELCLVGDGDLLPVLRARSPAGVGFFGSVHDVRPWYAAADVVVLPSRWEGMSLALLEALVSGRPVVATAVAGLAEAMPDGAGELVPPSDPAALAVAILRRLDDPARVRAESQVAAQRAPEFDARVTFDRLAALTERAARLGGTALPSGRVEQ
jgi:glycosyltransferase involved in cell wall biosynthesis